ncbi:MAG: hypothetical protein DVB31_16485 [Verrucomicrobia bacterium]|nr:MAG: hypothetical protein DVB31_16485 [Verrucomicrobiota bacterium]
MSTREFLRHNRWQKIVSLLLAMLIWFTVKQGLERGGGFPVVPDANTRTFDHLPIRVLTATANPGPVHLNPSEVTVVLRGRPDVLSRLRPQDVEVYVNLADPAPTNTLRRIVRVNAVGCQVGSVSPEEVLIERPSPSDNQTPASP